MAGPLPVALAAGLDLPDRWRLDTEDGHEVLTWTASAPVGRGDARVEILSGGTPLGVTRVGEGGMEVSVQLPEGVPATRAVADGLQVVAAGRRLDRQQVPSPTDEARTLAADELLDALRGLPTLAADPGTPGPYRVVSGEYTADDVTLPGLAEPVEVRALTVGPGTAPGERPLVVFLHGRHTTCFSGTTGEDLDVWPCPDGTEPVPSHRGYVDTQRLLASQGYVTVSISANGITGQDLDVLDGGTDARSRLVQHHLRLWASWSASDTAHAAAPAAVSQTSRADLQQLLLVGHSRGGEGVNRVALDSTTGAEVPWTVRGLVHLAPSAYGRNPAPGVPAVVVLPACDGDLYDLQGQEYVDSARDSTTDHRDQVLRSSVLVLGANHNYFNSQWTPGASVAPAWDDWQNPTDAICGTAGNRLSPEVQRQVGATYLAAAVAVFVQGDAAVLPLLDGTPVRAASAGDAGVSTHALGQHRVPVVVPATTLQVAGDGGVTALLCSTFDTTDPTSACHPGDGPPGPHFLPFSFLPGDPARTAVRVSWSEPAGTASLTLPEPVSVSGDSVLALRMSSRAGLDGTARFRIRITDAAGTEADLGEVTLPGTTDDRSPGSLLAREVRLSLAGDTVAASGIDLARVTGLALEPVSATGRVWLLDAWEWQPGLAQADTVRLPRLDAGRLEVTEGSQPQTVTLPVTVSGAGRTGGEQVWVGVYDLTTGQSRPGTMLTLPASGSVDVDVPVAADEVPGEADARYHVWMKAVSGVVVGNHLGEVVVRDDD